MKIRSLTLCLLLTAVIASTSLAEKNTEKAADDRFTVVLMPDTQFYSLRFPQIYIAQTKWIKERAKPDNIKFVIHLGDIVHNNTEQEWKNANAAMSILDGHVPYSVAPGNHDMATVERRLTRNTSLYNQTFPASRFEKEPWYLGHLGETNDNNVCRFEAAGMKFLVISLEFAPTDEALAWAGEIAKKHADHRIIVATHCYMRTGARDTSCATDYKVAGNGGQGMWEKLISKNSNIFMVSSGHIIGVGLQHSINDAGGKVIEMLTDYQGLENGGNGWLRTLTFVPAENKIHVRAYSPKLDEENKDPKHTYSLDYEMTATKKKAG